MKFIDKKISESYFQIYTLLSNQEKKHYIDEIKKELQESKQEELKKQINIYKNIHKKNNSESLTQKIEKLKEQYNILNSPNYKYDYKEIELLLCDKIMKDIFTHIETLNIIQIFENDFSIIGSIEDNNSLTVIYSFCYINSEYEMKFPSKKGSSYVFLDNDIDMIQTELLIKNNMYGLEKSEVVSEFSDIKLSYSNNSNVYFDIYMDISEIEAKLQIERSQLIGLDRNKYFVYNNNKEKIEIIIKEIYDKKVYNITDDIVKKIQFENCKSAKELREKIKEIFSTVYNVKSNIFSILDNMMKINEFKIDEYVYKHYARQMGEDVKEHYNNDEINEIKTAFITSYIFSKYNINIDEYLYFIQQEYNLLYKDKQSSDSYTVEEYINMRAPYYALYKFFKSKNLVTERSIYE